MNCGPDRSESPAFLGVSQRAVFQRAFELLLKRTEAWETRPFESVLAGFNLEDQVVVILLMRNIHRRFYPVVESVPHRLILAWTWNRLAEAV